MQNRDLKILHDILADKLYEIHLTINHKSYKVSWINPNTETLVYYTEDNKIMFLGITNETVLTALALN